MVRAKTVAGNANRGFANGSHKAGMKSHAATTSRHGFDGHLAPPNRQTANIVRQPVTLVHTTARDTKLAPTQPTQPNVRTSETMEKPRQIFWSKRLQNLRPSLLRTYQSPDVATPEPLSLPNRILPIGPDIDETTVCSSLACFLQNPSLDRDSTGQVSTKKLMESNPGVYTDPTQPLIQAVIISEQDIVAQERRVLDARRRLEEALKHFG